ncbi:MAG: hypothetical protein IAE93_09000 [Ignavibacteria bacterium]|nr:hypothetical protein [Ignavibacteria bacterium]
MENSISPTQPEADVKDIIMRLHNAGAKLVPGGSAYIVLMSIVVTTSLDKRKKVWLESIASGLIELKQKFHNFEFENLNENENFVTAFMHASQSALRNHQREKLEALKNAVLNSVTTSAPNDDLQLIFINNIDKMTQWHLRILQFYHDPSKYVSETTELIQFKRIENVLLETFTNLKGMKSFYSKVVQDLGSVGLVHSMALESGSLALLESQTTDLGKQFLDFVSSPIDT